MASILVVDDERDVVTLVRFILEKDGHHVEEAYNGAQALEMLGVEPPKDNVVLPDLVILDIMMPGVDGYTTATKMREHSETRSIPLIILTAKGQMREVFEMVPNVAAYIDKPFDPKNIRELVQGLLTSQRKSGT